MDFLKHAKQYGEGDKWGVLFHFIAFTGCRKGEALALNWSDIDLKTRTVHFDKTLSKICRVDGNNEVVVNNTTKNGETRTVTLDALTMNKLKRWKVKSGYKFKLIFPSYAGTYMYPDLVRTAMK